MRFSDGLIGAAKEENGVMPLRIHLNNGVACWYIQYLNVCGINADRLHIIPQEKAVLADGSGKGNIQSCLSQSNSLIEAFAALIFCIGGGGQGFALLH